MDKDRLFQLYEKLYFHELEIREKINNRVQLTLAILVTFSSIIAYMARMLDTSANIFISAAFVLALAIACILVFMSAMSTTNAFKQGLYKGLPSAVLIEEYRKQSEKYEIEINDFNKSCSNNEKIDNDFTAKAEMKNFLYDYFAKWSSHNTEVNDYRGNSIQEATQFLIWAALPLFFSSILFIGFDLDASSPRKNLRIEDTNVREEIAELKKTINNRFDTTFIKPDDIANVSSTKHLNEPKPTNSQHQETGGHIDDRAEKTTAKTTTPTGKKHKG